MAADLEWTARLLYEVGAPIAPKWDQLGDTTKGVWRDKARLKLAGHPRWWSIDPDLKRLRLQTGAAAVLLHPSTNGVMKMTKKTKPSAALMALAAAFTTMAEAAESAAAAFSSVGGEDAGDGDDDGAAKPRKTAAGSKAKVAKGKPAEDDDGPDEDTVREKMKELVEAKGKDKLLEAFAEVGAGKLADVDESQYQELIDKAQELIDAEDEEEEAKPAKKTAKGKAKAPAVTQKTMIAAAKALLDADAAVYKKVCKKLGVAKASEVEEDDYETAQTAFVAAMPEEDDAEI